MTSNLIVIYDPTGGLMRHAPELLAMMDRKVASLTIRDNLEPAEIAATAARLGLLLLEQIAPPKGGE